jgi:hypothetical protein
MLQVAQTANEQDTFEIKSGYAKDKRILTVRNPMSVDEMDAHCTKHMHVWLRDRNGLARQVKVNGAVRRWKRDQTRIEVPFKYGMYEYGTLTQRDIGDVLIVVSEREG